MNIQLDNRFATFSISKNLLQDPMYCRDPNSHAEKRAKIELGLLFTVADPTKPISVLRRRPCITSYILSKELHFESEIENDVFEAKKATPLWWMQHLGELNCRIGNVLEYMPYSFAVACALHNFAYSIDESWRIVCSQYIEFDSKLDSIIKNPEFPFPEFLESKFYTPVVPENTEPAFWMADYSVYQSIDKIVEIDPCKKTRVAPFVVRR